ncbi:MAG TPA: SatD family protein [Thermoleophilaceae bacterium]|nr:SatD family protein [Thermoleophilaceae bacterium]
MDQRGSRGAGDRVAEWADAMNQLYASSMRLPFVRTAGDEIQGVLGKAEALPDIVVRAVEDGAWWIGVGLGPVERMGATARDSQGPAFWHARQAVETAKKNSSSQPVAVAGEPHDAADALGSTLGALAFLSDRRTPEQQESVRLLRLGLKNKEIAAELNVTPPAISQRLRGAGADEEAGLRRLAVSIARKVVDP